MEALSDEEMKELAALDKYVSYKTNPNPTTIIRAVLREYYYHAYPCISNGRDIPSQLLASKLSSKTLMTTKSNWGKIQLQLQLQLQIQIQIIILYYLFWCWIQWKRAKKYDMIFFTGTTSTTKGIIINKMISSFFFFQCRRRRRRRWNVCGSNFRRKTCKLYCVRCGAVRSMGYQERNQCITGDCSNNNNANANANANNRHHHRVFTAAEDAVQRFLIATTT